MSAIKEKILEAMKATAIPPARSGLWSVERFSIKVATNIPGTNGRTWLVAPGNYTSLFRLTLAEMHRDPPAECVMNDVHQELVTHLDFCLRARGSVLVTGLGLGCVLRGLLVNPAVRHITVLERDWDVIRLVRPHLPIGRFIWNDPDKEEPALSILHSDLLCAMADKTSFQGAWNFPRFLRKRSHAII